MFLNKVLVWELRYWIWRFIFLVKLFISYLWMGLCVCFVRIVWYKVVIMFWGFNCKFLRFFFILWRKWFGSFLVFFYFICICSCVWLRYFNSFCSVVNFDVRSDILIGDEEMNGRFMGIRCILDGFFCCDVKVRMCVEMDGWEVWWSSCDGFLWFIWGYWKELMVKEL